MQFPESWLREFCDPPLATDALADLLTMSGMEVEERRPVAPPFSGVVVGHVVSVERHPNADRLSVCRVDVGAGEALHIVCGAPNVKPGIKVPCAKVGAELPAGDDGKPFLIKLGQLRGVESQGMLCSARELKLSDDHGGLLVLDDAAVVGLDIRAHLKLDDAIFTLKLTPNLAHCLSVYGVAREVSALTGAPSSSTISPAWSSDSFSSRAEHSMPWLSTPRSLPSLMTKGLPSSPGGNCAPTSAQGTRMPARTLGAPQTICRFVPVPASTSQTLSLSALACCATDSTCATTMPLKAGAAGRVSSTSMPDMVSSSASSAVVIGGLQNSRNQDSGNCMAT